jgi:hypothetical protein
MTRMEIDPVSLSPVFLDDPEVKVVCDVCGGVIYSDRDDDGQPVEYRVGTDDEGSVYEWHMGCEPEWTPKSQGVSRIE